MYSKTDQSRPTDKRYREDDPLDGLNVRHEGRGRSHHRDTDAQHGEAGADDG